MKKNLAFTLAETLIVIAIIGVVAALTLPNLNSSTADKEIITKVKKANASLTEAVDRAQAVYGPVETWFVGVAENNKSEKFAKRVIEFMRISKDCGVRAGEGCFASGTLKTIKLVDQGTNFDTDTKYYKFITTDGFSHAILIRNEYKSWYVDIDGPNKGKYALGHDIFGFNLRTDDSVNPIVPAAIQKTFAQLIEDLTNNGYDATSWIVKYDNTDYLKIEKIDDTAACPNGKILTEQDPNCN